MGKSHYFDVDIARKIGVENAIMLQNIVHWIEKNEANKKHFIDGRYWTYNSVSAFAKLFPYWTEKQIRRIINSLIEKDILLTGNYNEKGYDKTRWFALTDTGKSLCPNGQTDAPEWANECDQTGKPIPNNKPINKPNNTPSQKLKFTDEQMGIAQLLLSLIKDNNPNYVFHGNMNTWADQIRLMVERDGVSIDLIRRTVTWCQADPFWQSNILSTKTLRDKFNQLTAKMQKPIQQPVKEKTVAQKAKEASDRYALRHGIQTGNGNQRNISYIEERY